MLSKARILARFALCALLAWPLLAAAVDVDAFIKRDRFVDIKLSPTGEYYAATVPFDDRTALVILSRADNKLMGSFSTGKFTHVADFEWVNPERLLISTVEKFGALDQPQWNGEIYAMSVSGRAEILVGQRVGRQQTGSNIKGKTAELVAASLVDPLPADDRNVIVSIMPFAEDPFTRVERMDVESGRRSPITRAPIRNASFVTDNAGEVRFAYGNGSDNVGRLYYRKGNDGDWKPINDETASDRVEIPIGFSEDNKTAYLQVEHATGPDSIVAMDIASEKRTEVLRDDDTDPERIIYRPGTSIPVGVVFPDGKPRMEFFDKASPDARQYRSLQAAFPDDFPVITSSTSDGKLTLVATYSDRNPGDFYVFDSAAKKADLLISRREWFDPAKMAEARPVDFAARDGQSLKGFLTLPPGGGKNLPLIVMVHGGPFGIFDDWRFEDERQLLASAGYAVMQVNFRGSGSRGRAFRTAGARQWGGVMQDDVTDATRWAIQQGHADARRICIYGASYGAYAALMGVAKEPAMYRCAAGYVGVYDLPTMHTHGDIQQRGSGEAYLSKWLGERGSLGAVSPNRMADRIKVPVFLAAGGEDKRAPIEHSKMMERALKTAGAPVETLYYPTEGHGFYVEANRKEYYTRLLAFFNRHLGGATAATAAASGR